MDNLSLADVMAVSGRETTGFNFGGVGGLILILLFFIIFGWGRGGAFGGNTTEGLTLTNLERDVLNNQKDTENAIYQTSCATQKGVLENQYANLLGFKDMASQMASCCCDLKSTIIQENQLTRDLINQHYIDNLNDKIVVLRNQVNNQEQSNFILNQLGAYYQKPAVNPCTCYNTCSGYNGCNY